MILPQADLLRRASRGEEAAADELLEATGDIVYGFIYARMGGQTDLVDDIVQATYLEAIRSAHTFRGDSELSTWMCTIARRQLARYYKKERRRQVAESSLHLVDDDQDIALQEVADHDEMVLALGRLPVLFRQVLVMKYMDQLSTQEIASELGRSRIQVQSILQRARRSLRNELGRMND